MQLSNRFSQKPRLLTKRLTKLLLKFKSIHVGLQYNTTLEATAGLSDTCLFVYTVTVFNAN